MNDYRFINRSPFLIHLILVVTLMGACLSLQAADITVNVSRNPVQINESVEINFSVDGVTDGDPDFSPLQNDFEIINQGSNSQVSIINGSVTRNYLWKVTVIPKKTGGLIIPSIKFGSDASPAAVLQVNSASQQLNAKSSGDVFLEVEATPVDPYVQAQVVYTVRVFHKVGITQAGLSEPEVDNAVVEPLQKDSKYRTQRGNQTYDVFERRYTIFPQSSGKLVIAPIRLNAQVITGQSRGGFFSRNITRTERFVSKPIELNVKPIPSAFTGKSWLPARAMELTQSWSEDPAQAAVGEPVTQTMTLQAEGLMKSQLPALSELQKDSIVSSNIKIYPDQPVLTQAGTAITVISRREEKMAMIPEKSGALKIPAIEIPWWNTQTDRMEIARIEETLMNVKATSSNVFIPEQTQSPVDTTANQDNSTAFNISNTKHFSNDIWKWVSLALGLGWLLTLLALAYVLRSQKKQSSSHQQASDEKQTSHQRSRAGRNLRHACQNNQPSDARAALLNWAQNRWLENPPANLSDIGKRIPALQNVIEQLEQTLYNASANAWDGNALWEQFKAHRKDGADKPNQTETQLEPLFKA